MTEHEAREIAAKIVKHELDSYYLSPRSGRPPYDIREAITAALIAASTPPAGHVIDDQGMVRAFPRTPIYGADGAILDIVPEGNLYKPHPGQPNTAVIITAGYIRKYAPEDYHLCYSTREAAENAAKEAKNAKHQ